MQEAAHEQRQHTSVYNALALRMGELQQAHPEVSMQEQLAGTLALASVLLSPQSEAESKMLWSIGYFLDLFEKNKKTPDEIAKLVAAGIVSSIEKPVKP